MKKINLLLLLLLALLAFSENKFDIKIGLKCQDCITQTKVTLP